MYQDGDSDLLNIIGGASHKYKDGEYMCVNITRETF